jgi:oxaloacetate decarboxylase gamma subunit
MLLEAIKYMVLGMSVVYLFLYLMVLVLDFQHKIVEKFFPEKETPKPKPPTLSRKEKLKKVAAIVAAIHHMKKS